MSTSMPAARGHDRGEDMGLFGPASMAWTLHREPALLIGGLRALMVQALHPLAMAAVADFSDYRSDVWGRYARTTNYVVTTIFGTTAQALAVGRRVREVHRPMRGVDRVTGRAYAADDPELLVWVHVALVDSFVTAYERFVRPLSAEERDRYVAEMVRQAELVGLDAVVVPASWADVQAFVDRMRPELLCTPAARDAAATVLNPPLQAWRRPFWWMVGRAAVSIMPDYALALYGLHRHPRTNALMRPVISGGARFARRVLPPPPVLRAARRRARRARAA